MSFFLHWLLVILFGIGDTEIIKSMRSVSKYSVISIKIKDYLKESDKEELREETVWVEAEKCVRYTPGR